MNGSDVLRIVDQMQRDKNIPKEVIFRGIEDMLQLAAQKKYGEEEGITIAIDRDSGEIQARKGEEVLSIDPSDFGRIAAGSAKQLFIQKIREGESTAIMEEFNKQKGELVTGTVQRFDGGAATVTLGRSEALLPRSEQIPGETHHVGERIKAVILDVRKVGHRVKIILSRTHPDFVRQLFENEIPEIADRTIEIKAVAREAGYRTKVAVSSIDLKVDCVGACVGVRGSRIKNIVDELGGERIDIVRWNDSLQVLIPNALQPAAIEEVFLYQTLGRAIVLVKEDQLSLAIGRRGQNVRLASKLVGWDIEIMTHEELNESIERAEGWFSQIPNVMPEMVEAFITEGFLSYDDLVMSLEAPQLAEFTGMTEEQADEALLFAEEAAERVEEEQRLAKAAAAEAPAMVGVAPAPIRSTAAQRAAELFPEMPAEPAAPPKPTLESLFGPEVPAIVEPKSPPDSGETAAAPTEELKPEGAE
jgi:N utilization substance protein A